MEEPFSKTKYDESLCIGSLFPFTYASVLESLQNFLNGFYSFLLFVEMRCTFQLRYNTKQALLRLSSLSCSSSLFSHILPSHL